MIDESTIENLQILSQIELATDERDIVKEDLERIMGYFKDIENIKTDGIDEMTHLEEFANTLRKDCDTNNDFSKDLLSNAPNHDGTYIIVPKTVS